jgi:hypothetical protein
VTGKRSRPWSSRTPPPQPRRLWNRSRKCIGGSRGRGSSTHWGGSGLLLALGLAKSVRDWDLTTDAAPEKILPLLEGVAHERVGAWGLHADEKIRFHSGAVELIVRMAVRSGHGMCRIPTLVCGEWNGVPLGSAEAWAVAYSLLGRREKADLLFAHLRRRGADPEAIARLLREPLPAEVARRLTGLLR